MSSLSALQGVRLDGLVKLPQGRNAYGARLGSKGAGVTLIGTPEAGGKTAWSAALVTGPLALASLLSAGARLLGDVAITSAVIAVTDTDHDVTVGDLPPDLQRALAKLPGLAGIARLHLKAGVNLLAAVQVARSGVLGDLKQRLGIATEVATLRGAAGADLVRAIASGQTPRASDGVRSIDLSLQLGRIAPPGLEGVVQADKIEVLFKGAAQGLMATGSATFQVSLPSGERVEIVTTLTLDRAPPDRGSYFHFAGELPAAKLANLPHASSLALDSLTFDVALLRNGAQRVDFVGVTGHGRVGQAPVKIVGALSRSAAGRPEVTLWADGEVKLADLLHGHAVPGLDHIALTQVAFGRGEVAARARLGTRQIAVLAYVPAGRRLPNVVVGTGGIGLHDFVPALRGTPLDALALSAGAFFVVPAENAAKAVPVRTLPDLAVQLLGGPQALAAGSGLDLDPGVNLVATLDAARSPAVKSLLDAMGGRGGPLPLRGTLDPAMFNHTPWRRPGGGSMPSGGGTGTLAGSFLSHLDLRVPLPPLAPPGVAKVMAFKTGTLAITGVNERVAIGVTTTLELKVGEQPLVVHGEFARDPGAGGGAVLTFTAQEKSRLPHPFGLTWLSLDEVDVKATIDRGRGKVDVALGARAMVSGRAYAVTASFIEAGGTVQDVVFALKGRVPLSAIPGVGALAGLEKVELVDPELARTHVSGEIDLLETSFKVALLERAGHWDLLFQHSGFKLAELLPPLRRTVLADVAFPKAVLVLSQSGFARPVREFPAVIQPALAELGVTPEGTIRADPGLSLVAAIDPAKMTGPFGKVLHALGVNGPVLVSGGVGGVLGGSPSLNLQASLPKLPALPVKALRPRPGQVGGTLRLLLTGEELTVGVGTAVGFRVGRDDLTFDASLNASLSADDVVLDVQGRLDGAWHDPAGIKGLTLEDVTLTLGVNETGAIVVSLGGKARIGGDDVLVAAGASLLPEALGAPEAIAFVGRIDHFRFGDLVDVGTKFVGAAGATLPAGDLPHHDVELHGVTAALMTPGAYIDPRLVQGVNLGITGTGMAVAGTLVIDGKRLGSVSGHAGDQGVRLAGDLAPFHVGSVAIDKATLDAAVALQGAPRFTLATRARPFGATVDLDVGLDSKGIHFTFDDKTGGHYTASISARTTKGFSLSRDNDFALHAVLGPDFIGHFRGLVRSEVEALFAGLDRRAREAEDKLEAARRAIQKAEAEETAARRSAQRAAVQTVAQAQARVTDLERQVRGLGRDLAARHAAAVRAVERLEFETAAELTAEVARLRAEVAGATAALGVARDVLAAVRTGAPLPAAADPRLLAAVVALEAARAAVEVSEAAVKAAQAVNADLRAAAVRIGEPSVLDLKRAVIDGTIATGASLALDARIFGQRDVTVRAAYSVGDLKAIVAGLARAAGQIAGHLRSQKSVEHAPKPPATPGQTPEPSTPAPAPGVQVVAFDSGKYTIPVAQCGGACRTPPAICQETWPEGWYQQERPAGAGGCPAPPAGECEQVVLGPRAETDRYKGCKGYRVFDPDAGPAEKADDFVACAVAGRVLGTCPRPIVVGTGWSKIPATSATARALCQIHTCGWAVDLHEQQPGAATPSASLIAFDEDRYHIPASTCVAHCPAPPTSCAGPWSNQDPRLGGPRVDAKGQPIAACPAPPRNPDGTQCTQVVLGRQLDVERYKGCGGYVVLNRHDWTMERNDEFIACAVSGRLGATCQTPILIASGWKDTDGQTEKRGIAPITITAREMCQLRTCNWNVALRQSLPGAATPPGVALPGATDWPRWIEALKTAIRDGLPRWVQSLQVTGAVIHGDQVLGGTISPVSVRPFITGPMLLAGAPPEVSQAFEQGVAEAWDLWRSQLVLRTLTFPDLSMVIGSRAARSVPIPLSALAPTTFSVSSFILGRLGKAAGSPAAIAAVSGLDKWMTATADHWLRMVIVDVQATGSFVRYGAGGEPLAGPAQGTASGPLVPQAPPVPALP